MVRPITTVSYLDRDVHIRAISSIETEKNICRLDILGHMLFYAKLDYAHWSKTCIRRRPSKEMSSAIP